MIFFTWGKILTVFCECAKPQFKLKTLGLETLGWALEGVPPRFFVVQLGDFKAHDGDDEETWKGVVFCCWTSVLRMDWP